MTRDGRGPATSLWTLPDDVTTAGDHPPEPPSGPDEPFALSRQQDFLRMVDGGNDAGPFGPRYTIVGGWRVSGPLDVEVLRAALADVVERHEALRTSIVREPGNVHQRVRPPRPPRLDVEDLPLVPAERERHAEILLNEMESRPVPMDDNPTLRALLGRFDADDAVLVLAAHHTGVDGWSIQVVLRDLALCYAARRAGRSPELPPVRQYREYVRWQRATADTPAVAAARAYWAERLRGAAVTPIRMDRPRGAQRPDGTAWHRFHHDDDLRRRVQAYATSRRCTPFMVMAAAYVRQLADAAGLDEVVMPTFTPGRRPAWTLDMVGSFFNLLPLRVRTGGAGGFADLVDRVRDACLAAYRHEIPFVDLLGVAPELMAAAAGEEHASCVFQLVQSPYMAVGQRVGDLTYRAMRRRLRSQEHGSQIPDGALWAVEFDAAGGIVGSVGYRRDQFRADTVAALVAEYRDTLDRALPA
ncbi:condensation domain-containing protein [Micromonospora eburnea]|uniref:Condensation domain-containing protein n=1 Tax=Micromonospora eburnea TaxID=227316 RepID=A0A1C6UUL9_9ACTN|nr:condensation domain-containing protein [Micromonospora eburnea]SCL57519.1 Condensation domain-containing protein [Micromonospora eburnea]